MANYNWDALTTHLDRQMVDMEKGVGRALFELSSDIVQRTPVDEGGARGSWTTGINTSSPNFSNDEDKTGSNTIRRIRSDLKKFRLGDTVYTLSNLVYMPLLENGGYNHATSKTNQEGFSIQAPNGMVRVSIDNFNKNLEKALKE